MNHFTERRGAADSFTPYHWWTVGGANAQQRQWRRKLLANKHGCKQCRKSVDRVCLRIHTLMKEDLSFFMWASVRSVNPRFTPQVWTSFREVRELWWTVLRQQSEAQFQSIYSVCIQCTHVVKFRFYIWREEEIFCLYLRATLSSDEYQQHKLQTIIISKYLEIKMKQPRLSSAPVCSKCFFISSSL